MFNCYRVQLFIIASEAYCVVPPLHRRFLAKHSAYSIKINKNTVFLMRYIKTKDVNGKCKLLILHCTWLKHMSTQGNQNVYNTAELVNVVMSWQG